MEKPLVFVSSAVAGMRNTRALVQKLLQQDLGYEVVLSEGEGSKPRTPLTQCKKWARECDIYIGILGNKYGSIVPKLGISVTEMEFNEARKDNPEKILVYVSTGYKEPKQAEFVKRVEDFSEGYFRRKRFETDTELVDGIREDLAGFIKDRLDFIRARKLRVRPSPTPSPAEYITANLQRRAQWMQKDVIEVAKQLGLTRVDLFQQNKWKVYYRFTTSSDNLFIGKRKVGGGNVVLFSIWVLPVNLTRDYLNAYSQIFEKYIYGNKQYNKYPNRFTIFLVHGNATPRSLEKQMGIWGSRTCFKVEPGIFFGVSLNIKLDRAETTFHENMLFLSQVRNKEIMVSKLVDALEWLDKESHRINFRCNYIEPYPAIKIKPLKPA